MNHVCASCDCRTDPLTEHRSEVVDAEFHPECCPGGCDSPEDHEWPRSIGLPLPCAVEPLARP